MSDGAGFCDHGCLGQLSIAGVSLNTPAWDIPNPLKLLAEASTRGENTTLPGAAGRRGNPMRLDQYETDLAFLLNGEVNQAGTPYSDPWVGLETNLAYLWTNVFTPVSTGRGTRAASFTTVGGAVRTATVQVEPLHLPNDVEDPTLVEAVLHLIVVSGRFV